MAVGRTGRRGFSSFFTFPSPASPLIPFTTFDDHSPYPIHSMMEARQLAGAPVIPIGFDIYNSYVTDPLFARRFTWTWVACTVFFIVLSVPALLRALRTGRIWQGWAIYEDVTAGYRPLGESPTEDKSSPLATGEAPGRRTNVQPSPRTSFVALVKGAINSVTLRTVNRLELDVGQVIVILLYLMTLLVCVIYQAPLTQNSNRAGFLSLAQLPFVFLYASKSSPMTFFLGKGYEKLNFLHRWAGRMLLLSATIHGSLWIRFDIVNNQTSLLLHGSKERRGQASFGLLCLIVLASLRPVRRLAYPFFFSFHTLATTGFFISVCYHTPYAVPWIIPPVAFYSFDFLSRLIRMRFKDAYLEAPDSQITMIHVPDVSGGWVGGQHVRLRVAFDGRFFEPHPFTILNAPPSISVISSPEHLTGKETDNGIPRTGGLMLAVRNVGDWSSALNTLARSELPEDKGILLSLLRNEAECVPSEDAPPERRVSVLIDGPYGGSSVDFGTCENVLMISGGAGITFTLGVLDDLVGRIIKERKSGTHGYSVRTRRIQFVWCMRSYGAINWFARQFQALARVASDPSMDLDLQFRFFVTCYCDPTAVPPIANCEVAQAKPIVADMLDGFIAEGVGAGGLGVTASGPESLTSATRNAVAAIGPFRSRALGGVEVHTEAYAL